MEFGLYILWNCDFEPRLRRSEHEEPDSEDSKGNIPTSAGCVQQRFEELTVADADQGPKQKAFDQEDPLDPVHEGQDQRVVF